MLIPVMLLVILCFDLWFLRIGVSSLHRGIFKSPRHIAAMILMVIGDVFWFIAAYQHLRPYAVNAVFVISLAGISVLLLVVGAVIVVRRT
ncbi:hypothetical protein AN477_17005 [Alicyclobacillus ferrooxydans]|uniref:Uncharacterized protein n=1 Tax=Alicyclobacillus ferrooxydans TaxID=471514 RepID=A0A0P9EUB2_9BACL|nr:hypothetical protein AN477_17005 [Alicyclobacillus ferrooxydans]